MVMNKTIKLLTEYSLLLIIGAFIALIWANIDYDSYHHFVEYPIWKDGFIGHAHVDSDGQMHRTLTLHYLVNDLLMAFFFAVAGKEVWEAVALKSGSLRGKKSFTPLFATAGGMFGPIAVYLGLAAFLGSETYSAVANGWAIPTATDIAFSYLVGRLIFGAGHPAVSFLLLLAIADDAVGLVILAIFYPSAELQPSFVFYAALAATLVFIIANWLPRKLDGGDPKKPVSEMVRKRFSFWPYALAGVISWLCFQESGIHPALGLLFIIPAIPHAEIDFGMFASEEENEHDLLNDIEHSLKIPVEFILFFFGLMNAGVAFSSVGPATWLVLAGLLIGKPFGIFIFGWIAASPMKFGLPEGMKYVDLFVLGAVAAIGFTVSLFVASVAFPAGAVQDAAKMGALMSFGCAFVAMALGKLLKVEKLNSEDD
jgi:NhaA family Na+:H+ antiporter